MKRIWLSLFLLALAMLACSRDVSQPVYTVTATPPPASPIDSVMHAPDTPTLTADAPPDMPTTPTPNPTPSPDPEGPTYIVQAGDTLPDIALLYDTSVADLQVLNDMADEPDLYPGLAVRVPGAPVQTGPTYKIIPDSELMYGPGLYGFDARAFAAQLPGYLASYVEEIDGTTFTGAEIVQMVAQNFSVNPRVLLALLEYKSGWLLNPTLSEFEIDYPMGYAEERYAGLYQQLRWAADTLNAGYYGVHDRGLSALTFPDGTRIALAPEINAGTAAVQYLFAQTHTQNTWQAQVAPGGFYTTFVALFGNPFTYAVEPLLPPDLVQPPLRLPWAEDETWYYTGGPHGAWASGSAWGAVDFAPPGEMMGCYTSETPARAMAAGVVARSARGALLLDLDGDGYEGTGWVIFYLHLSDRAEVGAVLAAGDVVGYPSCEGGYTMATHVHIARKYNGEWMPAQCPNCASTRRAPMFTMGQWTVGEVLGQEYDGYMTRGEIYREAFDGGREDAVNGVGW